MTYVLVLILSLPGGVSMLHLDGFATYDACFDSGKAWVQDRRHVDNSIGVRDFACVPTPKQ